MKECMDANAYNQDAKFSNPTKACKYQTPCPDASTNAPKFPI